MSSLFSERYISLICMNEMSILWIVLYHNHDSMNCNIVLWRDPDGQYIARNLELGVVSQ